MEPILQLENVSLSFQGVSAISDVTFQVAAGEICAIIGPNGAGKSSMLNVINGVYHPQGGTVVYDGERRRQMQPHHAALRGIGRTFQNLALFKKMTVLENVLTGRNLKRRTGFFAQALRLPRARAEETRERARAGEILALLNLEGERDTVVGQLPYGLQKRVDLGRALAAEPRLLLLDEPMAGMTSQEKAQMAAFIRDANRRLGITVVLIEHDVGVVMALSDHIVVLNYGRLIADGTPGDVRDAPAVIEAYLGAGEAAGVS